MPTWLWPSLRASSIASSMTFFVRGESVISLGEVVALPRPIVNSTAVRTLLSSIPSESSARAATPSPSRTSPRSRCSVPM